MIIVYLASSLKEFLYLQKNFDTQQQYLPRMSRDLSEQEYLQVLKFMETTGQDDYHVAVIQLSEANFDLNVAINARLGQHRNQHQMQDEDQQKNDQETIKKYFNYLRNKNQKWSLIGSTVGITKKYVCGFFRGLFQLIAPQSWTVRLFRSPFYQTYYRRMRIRYPDRPLHDLLQQTRELSSKAVILAVSCKDTTHQGILELMSDVEKAKKIRDYFLFVGCFEKDNQMAVLNQEVIPPAFIVCRMNAFEQIVILQKFIGEQAIKTITVDKLNKLAHQSRNLYKRDLNVLIKYRNYIRRTYYNNPYEEQEEQEVNLVERQTTASQIQKQNEEYLKMEEEARKNSRLREENQLKKILEERANEEKIEERKARKASIPDEPLQGDNIVRISFRCPDGSNKIRRFQSSETIQLIYNWVELNDQIQFQFPQKRQFQILYSYPPTSLGDKKDKLIKDVFESDQEKVVIRQL